MSQPTPEELAAKATERQARHEAHASRPATMKDIYDIITVIMNQHRTEVSQAMTELSKVATTGLITLEALKKRGVLTDADVEETIKELEDKNVIKKMDQPTPS